MSPRWLQRVVLLCAALGACGSDDDLDVVSCSIAEIRFSPLFSAFGGSRRYSVTAFVPAADPASRYQDPFLASTLEWKVDPKFAVLEPFPEIPGAIMLTTQATGRAVVELNARRLSGAPYRERTILNISRADDEEWAKGEAAYHLGAREDASDFLRRLQAWEPDIHAWSCDLPSELMEVLPTKAACPTCHGTGEADISPKQTAGYSDDQLISIVSNGEKPEGYGFTYPSLQMHPRAGCIFSKFHAHFVDEDSKRGMIVKLRSLPPSKRAL